MQLNTEFTTQQSEACTAIIAALRGLENHKRISTLTFILAAAIREGANPGATLAIIDHVYMELRCQMDAKTTPPGLH